MKKNIYEKIGLKRVINASGRMTALGVSAVSDEAIDALKQASQNYVVIDDLLVKTGELISKYTQAEASLVACSASAAICLSCAAVMTGTDMTKIIKLPDTTGMKNEFVIQGGHYIDFGMPFHQIVEVAGGKVVIAGTANKVSDYDIEGAINQNTAALIYVKSHHCVQKGMVSIEKMIEIAHKHKLPIIVDASAEEDIVKYAKLGADLTCYSGAKAICGPTSGFVTGKKKYIDAARLQYKGIGRIMKVGKENAVGLVKAIELYVNSDQEAFKAKCMKQADYLINELKGIKGIKTSYANDEAGRAIVRVKADVQSDCKYTAQEIVNKLKAGSPAIYTREHYVNLGTITFDFRPLVDGDVELIAKQMKKILR